MNVQKLVTTAAAVAAGLAANKLLGASWKKITGHEPPDNNPEADEISIGELVVFAAVSGALIAFARTFAARGTAKWLGSSQLSKD
ncbi:DUF4235 domain-containing protein [Ruania suaedae]|uniref:DUF4235 domain-containing protein n=1 Tax=Ruania suaedae TaxID=2897774 RepID=UPI001E603C41|nr:DUF4235 domain-containing protein [Ruania suaedae]UFU02760.1 DUF4235 domain-containing protein [Ruania suaedae]